MMNDDESLMVPWHFFQCQSWLNSLTKRDLKQPHPTWGCHISDTIWLKVQFVVV